MENKRIESLELVLERLKEKGWDVKDFREENDNAIHCYSPEKSWAIVYVYPGKLADWAFIISVGYNGENDFEIVNVFGSEDVTTEELENAIELAAQKDFDLFNN